MDYRLYLYEVKIKWMRFYKSLTLTICTKGFLSRRLAYFDWAIQADPTLITEENKILRNLLGQRLEHSICGICYYNSRELIAEAHRLMG